MPKRTHDYEVIVIEDSDDESESEETGLQNETIIRFDRLTEQLNALFSKHESLVDEIAKWRMCMNPFRVHGFNCHASSDVNIEIDSISDEKEIIEIEDDLEEKADEKNVINLINDEISCDLFTSETVLNSQASADDNDVILNSQTSADDSELKEVSQNGENVRSEYPPYYLDNFHFIINEVINKNNDGKHLFNEDDILVITKFQKFSLQTQKLYVRLYQRKKQWFRCDKISYPKISQNLNPFFKELVTQGRFLASSISR